LISEDKTISGLLGASPGASISVDIMLDLINKSFGGEDNKIKIPNTTKNY
jgi:L-2-hydroxyglutarate oxidase LhgO